MVRFSQNGKCRYRSSQPHTYVFGNMQWDIRLAPVRAIPWVEWQFLDQPKNTICAEVHEAIGHTHDDSQHSQSLEEGYECQHGARVSRGPSRYTTRVTKQLRRQAIFCSQISFHRSASDPCLPITHSRVSYLVWTDAALVAIDVWYRRCPVDGT